MVIAVAAVASLEMANFEMSKLRRSLSNALRAAAVGGRSIGQGFAGRLPHHRTKFYGYAAANFLKASLPYAKSSIG